MPHPSRSAPGPPRRSPILPEVVLALSCALLAFWTQRRALSVYFHPDDVLSLEWASGILPPGDFGLWRVLSGKAYFGAALGVFGLDPLPYHVLNLLLHAGNVVLLYALVRQANASRTVATLAAGLFGTARPAFSVLQQAVGIGELLALGFTLGAFLVAERRSAVSRYGSAVLFALALVSKEAVLLLPLVLLPPREPAAWAHAGAWRERLRVAAPLLAVSVLAALTLVVGDVRDRAFGGEAYAMAFGSNLFHNLMTYVSWAADVKNAFFDEPGGISVTAWHAGLPLALLLAGLAALAFRRTPLPAIALAFALCAIAPVLPLTHHTYATYLYMPLAGLALALATSLGALASRPLPVREPRPKGHASARRGADPRTGLAAAVAVAVLMIAHAGVSDRLLGERVSRRMRGVDWPFDRQLRKSEMIRRAVEGLRRTGSPERMVLLTPPEASMRLDRGSGAVLRDSTMPMESTLLYRVLDGGRALRALVPGLDSVAFIPRWSGAYAGFDLCANTPAGDIVNFGRGPEAHLQLGGRLLQGRNVSIALELLDSAATAFPGDDRVRVMLAQARARAGAAPAR